MRPSGGAAMADQHSDHPYPPSLGRCEKAKRFVSDTRVRIDKRQSDLSGRLFLWWQKRAETICPAVAPCIRGIFRRCGQPALPEFHLGDEIG